MTDTVESLVQKGNTAFLAGDREDAILCYVNALEKAGALETVLRYIKKKQRESLRRSTDATGITL